MEKLPIQFSVLGSVGLVGSLLKGFHGGRADFDAIAYNFIFQIFLAIIITLFLMLGLRALNDNQKPTSNNSLFLIFMWVYFGLGIWSLLQVIGN